MVVEWGRDNLTDSILARYETEPPTCYICGGQSESEERGRLAAKPIKDFGKNYIELFHLGCYEEFVTIKLWKGEDPGVKTEGPVDPTDSVDRTNRSEDRREGACQD